MNLKSHKKELLVTMLTLIFMTAGCKQDSAAPESDAPPLAESYFAKSPPPSAKTVEEARKTAKAGDTVTLRGVVGGSLEPFVEGRAMFTLVGPGLKPCGVGSPMPDCKTPWDYCCDLPEDIAAHSATIQVVDEKGSPLKAKIKGEHNIKELSDLIVVGRVRQAGAKTLLIDAEKLYVAK